MKKKLTKPEMRVAIAKDVIKQVRVKNYRPKRGSYLQVSPALRRAEGDLQKLFIKHPKCTVCAYGGLFVSSVRLFNKACKFSYENPMEGYASNGEHLTKYFSRLQLALVESAFERRVCEGNGNYWGEAESLTRRGYCVTRPIFRRAINFGQKYGDNTKRLVAICKNIIKNDGKFIP